MGYLRCRRFHHEIPFQFAIALLIAWVCNGTTPVLSRAENAPATQPAATGSTTQPTTQAQSGPFHVDARKTLEYLASDELVGRGVGTTGLDKAADLIADDFHKLGLQPLPGCNDYFQTFKMTSAVTADPKSALAFADSVYALKKDFIPISFSGEGEFGGNVVFVGYGISSEQYKYDDYAELDVKGKIVLAMRFEPHNEKGTSRFVREDWSDQAHLITKVQAAQKHGAAGLVLVNPPLFHPGDVLMPFQRNAGEKSSLPVVQVTDAAADAWLAKAGVPSLTAFQQEIDDTGKPASIALEGVSVKGAVVIHREEKSVKNVMAMIPGEHADEYVVIGAHYDHLGMGGAGSLAPGMRAIHHGADDNASGTTAMLELADHYAHGDRPKRTLVFFAFTAEEEGLIGSAYLVNHPPIPLDKIVAMLNLDMVGRLRKHVIYVGGAGTAPSLDGLLKQAQTDSPVQIKSFGRGGLGPSDHMSFALKKVPVLFLFSGMHMDYHRPTDTADKINYEGIEEIVKFGARIVDGMEGMAHEKYVDAADKDSITPGMLHASSGTGSPSGTTLGVVPDYSSADDASLGVKITGTSPGSPAEKAGLKDGDVLVQWNADKLDSLQQLSNYLAAAKGGDKVKLGVMRGGKRIELEATLAERK